MILLIRHNDRAPANIRLPASVIRAQGNRPPMGLAYIASSLERAGHKVQILDAEVENMNAFDVRDKIKEIKPEVVGVTCMTPTVLGALEILKLAKEVSRNITTIIGGVHLSVYPNETISYPYVDYGVIGEGEKTIVELLNGNKEARGIAYKVNGRVVVNELREPNTNLSELPFPARHLLPNEKYHDILCKYPIAAMIESRGCPFSCAFCFKDIYSKESRARTTSNVVDEMEECVKTWRAKEILFNNDCFPSKKLMGDMCEEIIRRNLKVSWETPQRIDLIDKELLRLMKRAGCIRLKYGVESGNQHILDAMNKKTHLAEIENAFRLTQEAGIEAFGFFIVGYVSENENTLEQTINFAKYIKADWAIFMLATPLPHTEFMNQVSGIVDEDYWRKFTLGEKVGRIPFIVEGADKYCSRAYKQFYLRPSYITHKLVSIRSLEQFQRYVRGGLALARFRML